MGKHSFRHVYREGNERADQLVRDARSGFTGKQVFQLPHNLLQEMRSIRGGWDGGVSAEGSAGGWWLQLSVEHGRAPSWINVSQEAFCLPGDTSVTGCELAAAERLTLAVQDLLDRRACDRKRRRLA